MKPLRGIRFPWKLQISGRSKTLRLTSVSQSLCLSVSQSPSLPVTPFRYAESPLRFDLPVTPFRYAESPLRFDLPVTPFRYAESPLRFDLPVT
jgi:hypothetical protein